MPDFARSDHPGVQRQLDRLAALSPGEDVLGLERIAALLARLGHPERRLPPVFHVAGTNGKGSTCAYLRAALEAAGHKVHVYTSPHLVRFNERIRLAGALVDDVALAGALGEVLAIADGIGASFFEVTTTAALLLFARTPADACVVEVGLGGRLDATNVLAAPAVCGIAQLGIDHRALLGDTIEAIAAEKAGIAKPGVPLVTLCYPPAVAARVGQVAAQAGARLIARDRGWSASVRRERLAYADADGELDLPLPGLAGAHQVANAALAVAMLRHQSALAVPPPALRAAMGWAEWPARLQRLIGGRLSAMLPAGAELWLDGGHNPAAGRAIAAFFRPHVAPGRPFHLILGMLANKDLAGFLEPFAGSGAALHAVPLADYSCHDAAVICAAGQRLGFGTSAAPDVPAALEMIARRPGTPPVVLVGGSLHLAGAVLAANGTPPV